MEKLLFISIEGIAEGGRTGRLFRCHAVDNEGLNMTIVGSQALRSIMPKENTLL